MWMVIWRQMMQQPFVVPGSDNICISIRNSCLEHISDKIPILQSCHKQEGWQN